MIANLLCASRGMEIVPYVAFGPASSEPFFRACLPEKVAGINPYRYIPSDPALSTLRDDSIVGMKLAMVAFDALTITCLTALLRRAGLPTTRVLFYAWHPLPIWEFAGTGHVDALAIGLLLLAFLAASRGASVWTGIALAAATLVKFYPAVAGPALYRRWDWRLPVAFTVTLVLLYAPYLGVGRAVFGFLSGYANEEGLRSGDGIFLWALLHSWFQLPVHIVQYLAPLAALLMFTFAAWLQLSPRWRAHDTWTAAFGLANVFTLLISPHDPWYFTWLVPFLCFSLTAAHIWLSGACTLMYVRPHPTGLVVQSLLYVPSVVLLLLQFAFRRPLIAQEILHADPPSQSSA
jgi:hypothetical protein